MAGEIDILTHQYLNLSMGGRWSFYALHSSVCVRACVFNSPSLSYRQVQILQVLRVNRGVELQMFREELGNVKPLLHSSSPSSFVGILSR